MSDGAADRGDTRYPSVGGAVGGEAGVERAVFRGLYNTLMEGPGLGALGPSAASTYPSENGALGR